MQQLQIKIAGLCGKKFASFQAASWHTYTLLIYQYCQCKMTKEYRTLVRHTADLLVAVKMELISIGAELVSAELITPDQYDEIINPYRSPAERAARLVRFVQVKVQQDPQFYDIFVDIIKDKKYVLRVCTCTVVANYPCPHGGESLCGHCLQIHVVFLSMMIAKYT